MTTQLVDQIQLGDEVYQICEYAGEPMFTPEQLSLTPVMRSTWSWRGLWCFFNIVEGRLELDSLLLDSDVRPPTINRVIPEQIEESRDELFEYRYQGLRLPLKFDSRVIVGAKPIRRTRLPDDFRSLQEYLYWEEVRYWEFVGGELSRQVDCSELVDCFRDEFFDQREAKGDSWDYNDIKKLKENYEDRFFNSCGATPFPMQPFAC
ncbi:hypothetical protein [Pseudohaliea sp.]|uniref:hypothetical protein n=1 Tax=Pseudohaliea sp. TaxID=2740289 RepID=UPI0032EBC4A4